MSEHQPRDNPSGADNEQGSPTDTDLAWLAGLLDGDGWIGIARSRRPNSPYLRYTGAVQVMTTSERIAKRAEEIIARLGVRPTVVQTKAYVGTDGSPRRHKWSVGTRSNVATKGLLGAIKPHLVEKAQQASLVLDYIAWRDRQPRCPPGSRAGAIIAGMKARAEDTMARLRADRNRNDPSTITRLAPAQVRDDDMI